MMFEFIIAFEIIATILLIIGLIPFKSEDESNSYMNKIVCFLLATIIFFSLATIGTFPEKQNCFTNTATISGDVTTYTQHCEMQPYEEIGISGLNYGLGVVAGLLSVISGILAGMARHDGKFFD